MIPRKVGGISCGASGADVAKVEGVKQSNRDGLYRCKKCRAVHGYGRHGVRQLQSAVKQMDAGSSHGGLQRKTTDAA